MITHLLFLSSSSALSQLLSSLSACVLYVHGQGLQRVGKEMVGERGRRMVASYMPLLPPCTSISTTHSPPLLSLPTHCKQSNNTYVSGFSGYTRMSTAHNGWVEVVLVEVRMAVWR